MNVKSVKIINWHGFAWWGLGETPHKPPSYIGQYIEKEKECSYHCETTNSRDEFHNSQLVIFEGQPLSGIYYEYITKPPEFPQKEVGQKFMNFGFEHDVYFPIVTEQRYQDHIDYNMNFKNTSDLHITFACLWGTYNNSNGIDTFMDSPVKPFSEKRKAMAMLSYNCDQAGAMYRYAYARDLMSEFKLDSLGLCMHNTELDPEDVMPVGVWKDIGMTMKYKVQTIHKYLFVIAFENNNFTDYVSEKVFTAFLAGTVPIYMGADNIDQYVPEKSIIKVSDYKNAFELGKYLSYLSKNESAYNEYFEWKKKPIAPQFQDKYDKCLFYTGECRLCKRLTDDLVKETKVNDRHRIDFGEPEGVYQGKRGLVLKSTSCMHIITKNAPKIDKEFTIGMWILPDKIATVELLKYEDQLEIQLIKVYKSLYVAICDEDGEVILMSQRPIEMGHWRHIAFAIKFNEDFNAMEIILYINALEDTRFIWAVKSLTPHNENYRFVLGCTENAFGGIIDDLLAWNRTLSEREISKTMFSKQRGDEVGMITYLSCNGQKPEDYSKNHNEIIETDTSIVDVGHRKLDLSCC